MSKDCLNEECTQPTPQVVPGWKSPDSGGCNCDLTEIEAGIEQLDNRVTAIESGSIENPTTITSSDEFLVVTSTGTNKFDLTKGAGFDTIMEEKDQALADTNLRIDANETAITNNTNSIDTMTHDIETLNTVTSTNTSDIADLKSADVALANRVTNVESTTATHTTEINDLKTADASLTTALDDLTTTVTGHTSDIAYLKTTDVNLANRLTTAESELETFGVDLGNVMIQTDLHVSQIADLNSDVSVLKTNEAIQDTKLTNLQDNKQDKLTAGDNISIVNGVISSVDNDTETVISNTDGSIVATKVSDFEYDVKLSDKVVEVIFGMISAVENKIIPTKLTNTDSFIKIDETSPNNFTVDIGSNFITTLNARFAVKQDALAAGTNITIVRNEHGTPVISSVDNDTETAIHSLDARIEVIRSTDFNYQIRLSEIFDDGLDTLINTYIADAIVSKQNTLTAGDNITIVDDVISATSGTGTETVVSAADTSVTVTKTGNFAYSVKVSDAFSEAIDTKNASQDAAITTAETNATTAMETADTILKTLDPQVKATGMFFQIFNAYNIFLCSIPDFLYADIERIRQHTKIMPLINAGDPIIRWNLQEVYPSDSTELNIIRLVNHEYLTEPTTGEPKTYLLRYFDDGQDIIDEFGHPVQVDAVFTVGKQRFLEP